MLKKVKSTSTTLKSVGSAAVRKTGSVVMTAGKTVYTASAQATTTLAHKFKSEEKVDVDDYNNNNTYEEEGDDGDDIFPGNFPSENLVNSNSRESVESNSTPLSRASTDGSENSSSKFSERLQKATKSVVSTTKTVGENLKKHATEGGKAFVDVTKQVGQTIETRVSAGIDRIKPKDSDESEEIPDHQSPDFCVAPAPQPEPPGAVFGIPVSETVVVPSESEISPSSLPIIVKQTITCLLDKSWILEEGIFRLSAGHSALLELRRKYNSCACVNFNEIYDPHLPACLLKLFLRELPEPLFTSRLLPEFHLHAFSGITDPSVKISHLKNLVGEIPQLNRNILREIFALLKVVAHFSPSNRMGPDNLAIIFVPTLGIDSATLFHELLNLQNDIFNDFPSLAATHPNSSQVFACTPVVQQATSQIEFPDIQDIVAQYGNVQSPQKPLQSTTPTERLQENSQVQSQSPVQSPLQQNSLHNSQPQTPVQSRAFPVIGQRSSSSQDHPSPKGDNHLTYYHITSQF